MFPLFLVFFNIAMVLGTSSSGRYDILRGAGGEDACTLQNDIVASGKCTTSTRRDFSLSSILDNNANTSPVPSQCTCNEIFFNIWSACRYSTGNNTLPNFTQWLNSCTTSSINIESSTAFSQSPGNLEVDVPSWAKLTVPGNATFDLQRAVRLAFSTSGSLPWTTLQIILPVVVAVMTLVISGVVLLIYQRYQRKFSGSRSRMGWPNNLKRFNLRNSRRVTSTIYRDESWEIDGPVVKQPFEDVHAQSIPIRLSPFDPEPTDVHEYSKTAKCSSSVTEKGPTGFRVDLPWKRRPPHIKLVPATPQFRVDEVNTGSEEAVERNELNMTQKLAENFDDNAPGDDETTSLITANERATRESQDVILISRGGREFTLGSRSENTVSVNSHIKIISPSVSSESPHSSTRNSASTRATLYVPIPPPPPSHAAPAPPVMPRNLRPSERPSSTNREQSMYSQLPPFLSPIREASPTQSYTSSNTSLRQSSAIRRFSNPESISSPHNSNPIMSTASPPSYINLHRSASNNSLASESDIYMEVAATNGHDCSDLSSLSFYYNSPIQGPKPMHPVRVMSPLSIDDPAAFFPGPVRGAGYSSRKYTQ